MSRIGEEPGSDELVDTSRVCVVVLLEEAIDGRFDCQRKPHDKTRPGGIDWTRRER